MSNTLVSKYVKSYVLHGFKLILGHLIKLSFLLVPFFLGFVLMQSFDIHMKCLDCKLLLTLLFSYFVSFGFSTTDIVI